MKRLPNDIKDIQNTNQKTKQGIKMFDFFCFLKHYRKVQFKKYMDEQAKTRHVSFPIILCIYLHCTAMAHFKI